MVVVVMMMLVLMMLFSMEEVTIYCRIAAAVAATKMLRLRSSRAKGRLISQGRPEEKDCFWS